MTAAASSIHPYFVYRDGAAALAFPQEAFGFERLGAYAGDDGAIVHAEMRIGEATIMLGTATDAQRAEEPWDLPGGRGIYVTVDDVDAHHMRAAAAGARIVYGPQDTEFGTRRYRALDIDGYEWSFGTYRPGGSPAD